MAVELGDPWPDRITIRTGSVARIILTGHFICLVCSRPSGARAPKGRIAIATYHRNGASDFGLTG